MYPQFIFFYEPNHHNGVLLSKEIKLYWQDPVYVFERKAIQNGYRICNRRHHQYFIRRHEPLRPGGQKLNMSMLEESPSRAVVQSSHIQGSFKKTLFCHFASLSNREAAF